LPLTAEAGQTGLYEYFNEASPPATTFVGSISGTTLTVTSATSEIGPNHILSGTGVLADTYITDRLTGRGGTGTYRVDADHAIPTGSITITASAFTGTPYTWGVEPRTDGEHGRYLRVQTEVISGGPPYNYSGWGCWQTWAVNPASEPFLSFKFDFDGGNCGRNIGFSTNAQDDEPTANVECLIPCLPSAGGAFTAVELLPADLWRTYNVVMEYQHKEPFWISIGGTSTATTLELVEYLSALALKLEYDTTTTIVGPNLVVNGDFSTALADPPWKNSSGGDGTVTLVGGKAVLTHTATPRARLRQGLTVEAGASYLIEFTCSGFVGP